jgi:hypothetical protein
MVVWESASVIAPCFCVLRQDYGNWKWDSGCRRTKGLKRQQEDEGKEQKEKRENGWRLKGIERRKRES